MSNRDPGALLDEAEERGGARRRLIWIGAVIVVIAVVAVTTGILLSRPGSSSAAADAEEPVSGGTLTIGVQTLNNADPQQVGNNDQIALARQLVAGLTIASPDDGKIYPWIAESWTINDDATAFTFVLKDGITFWDGTPIDAAAVKANYDSILANPGAFAAAASYLRGATTTVIDDRTVEVSFEEPNAQFLEATSTFRLGLISVASTELSVDERTNGGFVGSGPFRIESFDINDQATLVRYDDYNLSTEVNSNKGTAYLDKVVFESIPENGVRSGSLQSGDIDIATFLTTPELDPFRDQEGFSVISRANPGVVYHLSPYLERSGPIQELAVRQAIQKAIDRDTITSVIYGEGEDAPTSVLAETTPLTSDLSDLLAYDPEGAKQILDDAGWVVGADGIREKDGQRLQLSFVFYQEQDPVLLVQQQLLDVGIDLQVQQVSSGELSGARETGQYDFGYGNSTRNEADQLRNSYESDFESFAGLGLDPETQAPDVDEILSLLQEQLTLTDETARAAAVEKAQTLLIEDGYAFPVYQLVSSFAVSDRVQDVDFAADSRLDLLDAWIAG